MVSDPGSKETQASLTPRKPKPCSREGLTYYLMPILMLFLFSLLAYQPAAAQQLSLENALAKPILAANQPLVEVQVYTASHVKSMPLVSTAQQWTQTKEQLRQQLLNEVVLRGQGRKWAEAKTRVEWLDVLPGQTPTLRVSW